MTLIFILILRNIIKENSLDKNLQPTLLIDPKDSQQGMQS